MDFLKKLPRSTLAALLSLIVAKGMGFCAMLATYISFNLAAVLGILWSLGLVLTLYLGIRSWYKDIVVSEKDLYERLKVKFENT